MGGEILETRKDDIADFLQGALFTGTPFIVGILLDAFLFMMIVYALFISVNIYMEKISKKQHAPNIQLCWSMSNMLLVVCVVTMRLGDITLPLWQTVCLGVMLITVSTFSTSAMFHNKPKNENIETKKSLRDELAKMSKAQAKEYLYDRLPENEAAVLYWVDWERKPLGFVAFNKIDSSETVLKELRSSAYYRLRAINNYIDTC